MDDPDAIWKPGYDGPPPIVENVPEPTESTGDPDDDAPPRPRRRRRRWVGVAAAAVGVAVVAAVVVLERLDTEPDGSPDRSVIVGPEARRLPRSATSLWSVEFENSGDHWVDVVGRDLVLVALAEPTPTLVAFDAPSGDQRWTIPLPAGPGDVALVAAVGGVLVLEQQGATGSTVSGVDVATGETRWTADAAPNEGHLGLVGTPFVARLPAAPDRSVTLVDAASGRDVGTIPADPAAEGRPGGWFTDRRGTWYVLDDREVLAYDLRSQLGPPTVVGRVGDVGVLPVVVGQRLAVVNGTGSIALVGSGGSVPVDASAEVPAPVLSVTPVSDSTVVVTSPGTIAGLAIGGDSVEVAWSRSAGALAAQHPIEGGALLEVATRGGGATELVDGATGATVEQLTMVAGALQALVVAGDGVVVLRGAPLGTKVAGVEFDGTERWSILGPEPVVVGDRVVVRAASSEGQLRVTVHGDAE